MRPSFEALYRGHFGLVWALVSRAGVASASREDAVQEVWLTVHRRLPSYDGTAPAASWIAGIARHVVWRQIRATIRAHRKLVALDRVAPDGLDDPVLARERMRGIEGVIAGLEPAFREAFVAVEIFGATGPEAAEQLGLPLNTLYSRLRLARARVHAGLDALEQTPAGAAPRGLAERTWLAIAPSLGIATAAPSSMLGFAGGLAAIVAVAIGTIAIAEPPAAPSVAPAAIASAPQEAPSREPAPRAQGIAVLQPSVAPPQPAVDPVLDAVVDAGVDSVATPPAAIRGTGPVRAPGAEPDEGTLIARAIQARRSGEPEAAMAAIAEHERRFPDGALAIERKVERVRALCAAGKPEQARGEARALARAHPERVAVAALGEGCAATP